MSLWLIGGIALGVSALLREKKRDAVTTIEEPIETSTAAALTTPAAAAV